MISSSSQKMFCTTRRRSSRRSAPSLTASLSSSVSRTSSWSLPFGAWLPPSYGLVEVFKRYVYPLY
jgi:hypothetical protein